MKGRRKPQKRVSRELQTKLVSVRSTKINKSKNKAGVFQLGEVTLSCFFKVRKHCLYVLLFASSKTAEASPNIKPESVPVLTRTHVEAFVLIFTAVFVIH